MNDKFKIREAGKDDVPVILSFIKELAEYEKLSNEVKATEDMLRRNLFEKKYAEVLIGELNSEPVGFALFFHNFSTFLGKPGIYLEDLYVMKKYRGRGFGRKMLSYLAKLTAERDCGRLEWSVLDWNKPAIDFYLSIGAVPMEDWTVYRLTGKELSSLADRSQLI
ncbi:MAG: GNAT family N-acetyltransferase [Candidatus Aminicenantes bacterium]|nr:GNAT family N-acetyltransferase [Candidatus Aminicenantes bacterium]